MALCRTFSDLFCLWNCFVVVLSVEPHPQIKDKVESMLKLTPWTWKLLKSSFKVESPVTLDVALTSRYRLTGNHLLTHFRSCKDILLIKPESKSGEYTIFQDTRKPISVFCEFLSKNHGYTYLKDYSESRFNLSSICSTTDEIKVVHLRTSGKRYGTILEELKRYQNNYSLSLQINKNKGFNTPKNAPFLGKYIYVGFLPRSIAARRSIQGYRAGSKDWEFNNCDANPNSYIAFFYNNSQLQTHSYHKGGSYNKYMRRWIDVSKEYSLPIPAYYFQFFEMHMGGCGGYGVPNHGTFSDIVGAVPGFRFDVTCSDIQCHHGRSCIIANGGPTCLCPLGYLCKEKEKVPFSCKDIAISKGPITGEYLVYSRTKQSQSFKVFCEFQKTYGLTFVSNTDVIIDVVSWCGTFFFDVANSLNQTESLWHNFNIQKLQVGGARLYNNFHSTVQ